MECNSNNRYHITAEEKQQKKYNAAQKTGQIDGQTYGQADKQRWDRDASMKLVCTHRVWADKDVVIIQHYNVVRVLTIQVTELQTSTTEKIVYRKTKEVTADEGKDGWLLYAGTTSCKGCRTQRLLDSPVEWNAWNNITAHERNEVMMEGLKLQW